MSKTFFFIMQKIMGITNIYEPDGLFSQQNNCFQSSDKLEPHIHLFICNLWLQNNTPNCNKARNKFAALSSFLDNQYIKKELKDAFLNAFSNAQRIANGFNRLAAIWKYKNSPIRVTTDLSMNPLSLENPSTIKILHKSSAYLFSLNDLLNIIETSLCNAPMLFLEPQWPKNPWNNCHFTCANLLNIYIHMLTTFRRPISTVFHLYFREGFNLQRFVSNHESLLKDIVLKRFVFKSPTTTLYPIVISMLKGNPFTKRLTISKDFPKKLLVEIFQPFLYYEYVAAYGTRGTAKINNCRVVLYCKLKRFYEYNKCFGRRQIHFYGTKKAHIEYNTRHLGFYQIKLTQQEINSHMNYHDAYDDDDDGTNEDGTNEDETNEDESLS